MANIVIMGGTFNPIHNGHIEMMRTAAKYVNAKEVLIIPTGKPKYKQVDIEDEHRIKMIDLFINANSESEVDYYYVLDEIENPEEFRCSVDTLKYVISEFYSNDTIYFVVGSDQAAIMSTWMNAQELHKLCNLIIFPRHQEDMCKIEEEMEKIDMPKAQYHIMEELLFSFSSTDIRNAIANGSRWRTAVPKEIGDYIVANKLYQKSEEDTCMKDTMALTMRKKIVDWIKDYFNANGSSSTKAIIGMSGGKDSTVAAALCVEALGKDRVIGVIMPINRMGQDMTDAVKVCDTLGIKYKTYNLEGVYKNLSHILNTDGIYVAECEINIQPRLRMTTLYAVAAQENGFVINTSNKCEAFVGYCTKWGDNVGDLAPLVNYTVSEIIAIGKTYKDIPVELIVKTPADGLSGMSDEKKLGFTYDEVESAMRYWYNDRYWDEDGEPNNYDKIIKAHKATAHKRAQIPKIWRGED